VAAAAPAAAAACWPGRRCGRTAGTCAAAAVLRAAARVPGHHRRAAGAAHLQPRPVEPPRLPLPSSLPRRSRWTPWRPRLARSTSTRSWRAPTGGRRGRLARRRGAGWLSERAGHAAGVAVDAAAVAPAAAAGRRRLAPPPCPRRACTATTTCCSVPRPRRTVARVRRYRGAADAGALRRGGWRAAAGCAHDGGAQLQPGGAERRRGGRHGRPPERQRLIRTVTTGSSITALELLHQTPRWASAVAGNASPALGTGSSVRRGRLAASSGRRRPAGRRRAAARRTWGGACTAARRCCTWRTWSGRPPTAARRRRRQRRAVAGAAPPWA